MNSLTFIKEMIISTTEYS